jgi:hypothetical protein
MREIGFRGKATVDFVYDYEGETVLARDEGDWYKCDVCDGNGENLEKHIESQARSEG